MKKKICIFLIALFLVVPFSFCLTACGMNQYRLKFFVDGEIYYQVELLKEQEIEFPIEPEKPGYVFDGWYFDEWTWENKLEEGTVESNLITRHVDELFAKWSKIYKVNFVDQNGLSLVDVNNNEIEEKEVKDGSLIGAIPEPYKQGYTFVGWEYASYPFDLSTPIENDTILVAIFEQLKVEVSFYDEDGELVGNIYEINYGDTFSDIPSVPKKKGYTGAWNKQGEDFVNLTEDIEVRPVYTAKTYKINLNYGENMFLPDEISVKSIEVTYDSPVGELPTPSHKDYNFLGWICNGEEFTSDTIWEIDGAQYASVYANWQIKTYVVTYKKDENSPVVAEVVFGYNGEIIEGEVPEVPEVEGHKGVWNEISFDGTPEDIEIYATYTPNTYKASVNANGGSVSVYNLDITYGEQFFDNLPTPTWTNYDFLGWYINNVKVEETDVWTFANNETTIVAKWQVTDTGCIITSSNVFEIDGVEYYFDVKASSITLVGKLRTSVDSFCLTDKFNVSEGATWFAYDYYSQNVKTELRNNTIGQLGGKVTKYIEVTNAEKTEKRLYTVSVIWNQMIDVSFYDKNVLVETIKIEEGTSIQKSEFPTVEAQEGFRFIGWESELNDGIVEDSYLIDDYISFNAVFETDDTTSSQGLAYTVGTNGAYITGIGTCTDKNVVIPKFIDGKHYVVGISTRAFADLDMTSVFIPNSVEEIGYYAFQNLESLTSVTFEQNSKLKILYYNAFDNVAISTLIIPNSIERIYESTESVSFVSNCENLTTLKIEDGNGKYITPANSNCVILNTSDKKLIAGCKTTIIPNDIKIIGGEAFAGSSLKSVVVPKSVEIIQTGAFENCEELESITFESGSNLSKVEYLAFSGCSLLKSITLPNSLQSISSTAFVGCDSLESILNFHTDNLNTITGEMFSTLTSLKTLTTREDSSSFANYPNSNALITKTGVLVAAFDKSVLPEGIVEIDKKAFYLRTKTSITIPSSVLIIGEKAFSNCQNLESIKFKANSTLKEIKDGAFQSCKNLKNITFPDSVETIGKYAFSNCSALTSVTLSDSLTSIGEHAFSACINLKQIIIPSSVTEIERCSFYYTDVFDYYQNTLDIYCEVSSKQVGWNNSWYIESRLKSINVYWYSATEPTEEGNYWHYGTENEVLVWGTEA